MNKNILVSIAAIGGLVMVPFASQAADLEVVCTQSASCSIVSGAAPLFTADNIVPGGQMSRTVDVRNERGEDCALAVSVRDINADPDGFVSHIEMNIQHGSEIHHSGMLSDADTTAISLGTVPAQGEVQYAWSMGLSSQAGIEYEGALVSFDIDMHFECMPAGAEGGGSIAGITDDGSGTPASGIVKGITSLAGAGAVSDWVYVLISLSAAGAVITGAAKLDRRARIKKAV
jgi:hypothetical protein